MSSICINAVYDLPPGDPAPGSTLVGARSLTGEALPLLERALAITESVYGPDHPEVAMIRANRANGSDAVED